jgi:hypothetical protein
MFLLAATNKIVVICKIRVAGCTGGAGQNFAIFGWCKPSLVPFGELSAQSQAPIQQTDN